MKYPNYVLISMNSSLMDHWKKVIFEWVKACDVLALNLLTLEDARPDQFFEIFAQYVSFKPSNPRSAKSPLIDFLEEFYPEFTPELNEDGSLTVNDYPIVYTLFLHYVNFNSEFFEFFCDVHKLLPSAMKPCIDLFLEAIKKAPCISRTDLYECIANLPSDLPVNSDDSCREPGKPENAAENEIEGQVKAADELVESEANEGHENKITSPGPGGIVCSLDYFDTFDEECEANASVDISVRSPLKHSTPYSSDRDSADSTPTKYITVEMCQENTIMHPENCEQNENATLKNCPENGNNATMEMSDRNSESHKKRINELQSLLKDKESIIKILRTEHVELRKRPGCVCQELSNAIKDIKAGAETDLGADIPDHEKQKMRRLQDQNESMANELTAVRAKLQAVLELPQDDNLPPQLQMTDSTMDQIALNNQSTSFSKESIAYKTLKVELVVAQNQIDDLCNELSTSDLSDRLNSELRQNKLLRSELEQCQDQLFARNEFILQLREQLDDREWNDLEAMLNRIIANKSQLRLKKDEANLTKLHFICSFNHETLSAAKQQWIWQPTVGEPGAEQSQLLQKLMAEIQKRFEQKLAECFQQLRAHDAIATDLLDVLRESNKLPPAWLGEPSSGDKFEQLRTQLVQFVSNYRCLEMVKREPATNPWHPKSSERVELIKQLMPQVLLESKCESTSQAKQLTIELNEFASEHKALQAQCQKLQDQLDYRTGECNWFGEQLSGLADYIRKLGSLEPADKRRQKLTVLLGNLKNQLIEHLRFVSKLDKCLNRPDKDLQILAVHQKRWAGDLRKQLNNHIAYITDLLMEQQPLAVANLSEVQYLERLLAEVKEQRSTRTVELGQLDLELKSCEQPDRQAELQTQLRAVRQELYVLNKKRLQLNQLMLDVELMPELVPMHPRYVKELQLQLQAARDLISSQRLLANMKKRLEQNQPEPCDDPGRVQLQRQVKELEEQLDASQGLSQSKVQKQDDANPQRSQTAQNLLNRLRAAQKRIQVLESTNRELCHKKQLLEEVQLQLREKEQRLLGQLQLARESLRREEGKRMKLLWHLKTYQREAEGLLQELDQSKSQSSEREAELEGELNSAKQEIDERRQERRNLRHELLKYQEKEQQLEEQMKELQELKLVRDQRRSTDTEKQLAEKLKIVTQDLYKREHSYRELIKTANIYHQQLQQLQQAQHFETLSQQGQPLVEQLNATHRELQKWKIAYAQLSETIKCYHQQVHQLQAAQRNPDKQLMEELRATQQSLHEEETAHRKLMQQIERLQQELDETRKQIDEFLDMDEQHEPHEQECVRERLKKKMASYRGRLERLQRELGERNERLMKAEQQHEGKQKQLSKELASCKNQVKRLQQQLAEANKRGNPVRQWAEAPRYTRDPNCTQLELSKKLADYKHQMESMIKQVQKAQETETVTEQLKSVQQELDGLSAKHADVCKELSSEKQIEETLQQELNVRNEELHKLQIQLEAVKQQLDKTKLQLKEAEDNNTLLLEEVKMHKELASRAKQELAELLQKTSKQPEPPSNQAEINRLNSLVEKLREERSILLQEMEVQERANRAEPPNNPQKREEALQEEVNTLKEVVNRTERELNQFELNKLNRAMEILRAAVKTHHDVVSRAMWELAIFQQEIKQSDPPSNRVELDQLKRSVEKLEEQKGVLQRENEALQAEIKTHQELASRAERKLAELRREHAIVEESCSMAGQQVKYLERKLKVSDTKFNNLRKELNIAESEKVTLVLEVGGCNAELQQQQKISSELVSELRLCQQQLNSSEVSHNLAIGELRNEIANLELERKQIAERENLGRSRLDEVEMKLVEANVQLFAVVNSHNKLLQEHAYKCQQLETNRETIEKLTIECRQLQETSTQIKINRQLRNTVTILSIATATTCPNLDMSWDSQKERRIYDQD